MAQVPYQPVPEERPASSQGIDVPSGAFGGGVAKAIAGVGQDVQQAAGDIYGRAVEMQKQKIEADVNERVVQFFKDRGDLDNTFRNMQGASPQENLAAHKASLENAYTAGRKGIPSLYGQNMYDRDTRRQLAYDFTNSGLYAATELKKYNRQSYENKQLTMADSAAKDPNNMLALNTAIENITEDEKNIGASEGSPPEMVKAQTSRKVAGLIGGVASTKSIRDPEGAMTLLETMKDNKTLFPNGMPQDIYQKTLETITQRKIQYHSALDARSATGGLLPSGHPVTENAPAIAQTADSNGWNKQGGTFTPDNIYRLVQQESAGQNLPPNKYGYAGYFQMKPSEFGYTPQDFQKMSFEQQLDIYANKYLKKYGYDGTQDLGVMNAAPAFGSSADTTIAYGPGSVEAKANPQWVRYSQANGAVTVAGIKAWAAAGAPAGQMPEVSLPEVAKQGEELAKKRFPDDPISQERYLEQFLSHAQRNSTLMRTQINQQIKASRNAIDSVLFNTAGGDRGPTSIDEASRLNPNFQQMWDDAVKINPSISKHINDMFNYNAKMDVPLTPERFSRFQAVKGLAVTNPDEFIKMSPASLDLPRAQTNEIYTKQLSMSKKLQDTTHLNATLRTLQPMLADAGIAPSHTDTAKAANYNLFVGALQGKLEAFQQEKGKPPNEAEKMSLGAELLRETTSNWFFANDRAFEVPTEQSKTISTTFKARYNRDPNPAEVSLIYQRMMRNAPTQQ